MSFTRQRRDWMFVRRIWGINLVLGVCVLEYEVKGVDANQAMAWWGSREQAGTDIGFNAIFRFLWSGAR